MRWAWEDLLHCRNMLSCPHTELHTDGRHLQGRWQISAVHDYYRRRGLAEDVDLHHTDKPYIWATGTQLDPDFWAGFPHNPRGISSLFDIIPHKVIEDAAMLRALIIIDSCNEGFTDTRLHHWLHSECARLQIPCGQLIYVTSNLCAETAYAQWADQQGIRDRITVISLAHWHYQYSMMAQSTPRLHWSEHEQRKGNNDQRIALFSCLNHQWRPHREYLLLRLIQAGLHTHGAISHGPRVSSKWLHYGIDPETLRLADTLLPLTVDRALDRQVQLAADFNPSIYTQSWISLITETMAEDEADCCFVSEKTFKPINALQPFMVLGHAGTLARLNSWGYQTFSHCVDESYDQLPFMQRIQIIIRNLYDLWAIRDRWYWLESCVEICRHNQDLLLRQDFFKDAAHERILAKYSMME